jgi:tetratricopeptide (TPR) repeat protein
LGYLEEARTSLSQAVTLFDHAKDQAGRNDAMIQLGLLQVGNGSSEQGLSALQQVRQEASARRDRRQELAAVMALGTASWLLERTSEASRYYEEGLSLAEQERETQVAAALRLRLAYLYAEAGRPADAVESAKRALTLSQTLRDAATEAAALSLLNHLYRQSGRPTEADEAEQRALLLYSHRQTLVHGGR